MKLSTPLALVFSKLTAERDWCGELRRRPRGKFKAVPRTHVLEMQVNLVKRELRSLCELVVPSDRSVAYDDVALLQQPLGKPGPFGLLRLERNSGDENNPIAVTTNLEPRFVQFQ